MRNTTHCPEGCREILETLKQKRKTSSPAEEANKSMSISPSKLLLVLNARYFYKKKV